MRTIIVDNNTSYFTPALIFIIIFLCIMMYLWITSKIERNFRKKVKKAKTLIEEGHQKALLGRKDDGLYVETKKLREPEEEKKDWQEMVMEGYHAEI